MAVDRKDEQKRILKLLPEKPEQALCDWVEKAGFLSENIIIFRHAWIRDPITGIKEHAAECRCTACGEKFYEPWLGAACARGGYGYFDSVSKGAVGSGSPAICPECMEEATAQHIGGLNSFQTIDRVMVADAVTVSGIPALIFWRFVKIVNRETAQTHFEVTPLEAYVFSGRRCYRFVGWYKYFSRVTYLHSWETRAHCSDEIGDFSREFLYPRPGIPFEGTALENAHFARYMNCSDDGKCCPVTYLRTFQQHPQVENLIMQGCVGVFNEIVYANAYLTYYYKQFKIPTQGIDWKQKTPSGMLGLDRAEFRRLQAGGWTLDELELYKFGRAHGIKSAPEDLQGIKMQHHEFETLLEKGQSPAKAARYLSKQNKYRDRRKMGVSDLMDYWRMCERQTLELTPARRWPQNLTRAHDQLVQLQNEQYAQQRREDRLKQYGGDAEKAAPGFQKLQKQYAGFSFAADGLCVRIAATPMELIEEGTALDHCVASCISTHAGGERCIFFVRRADEPEKPYYTLELNMQKLTVIRDLGLKNCKQTPQVLDFEKAWLEYIRQDAGIREGA